MHRPGGRADGGRIGGEGLAVTREALTPVLANLPGTAADHCGMMGCLAVDLLGASCAATGNLEA